jgi:N-formylglutamate amidohydrolase
MTGSDVLVVVGHSGVVIPPEISLEDLTDEFTALLKNVDWYTQWLYDFRDILGNRQLVFPYCSILLDANRDPADIDECVPVRMFSAGPFTAAPMSLLRPCGRPGRTNISNRFTAASKKTSRPERG